MIIRGKLIAVRNGAYSIYVFKNLESDNYVMCTRLPNWQTPDITIGDIGFLKYEEVVAGQSYFNPATQTSETYKYSNVYFENFVKESDIVNLNIIL